MTLLTVLDNPAIRAVIDLSLTAADVPDATIALDAFQGQGEARVLARFPDAASLTGDDAVQIRTAAICFVAALVAESLPRVLTEFVGRRSYGATKAAATADMLSIAAGLRGRGEAALASIVSEPVPRVRPISFSIARGGRGR